MWIQTHHHLANLVYRHVKENYELELKLDMLQYGSIKPDLHWEYHHVSHYYEEGYSLFMDELSELVTDEKYGNVKDFSLKLGVILHFVADFFCYAHNNKVYKRNLWSHLNYELKLHHYFLQYEPDCRKVISRNNLFSLVMNLRKRYLECKPGVETDARYIWQASIEITDVLLKTVLLPAVKAA